MNDFLDLIPGPYLSACKEFEELLFEELLYDALVLYLIWNLYE